MYRAFDLDTIYSGLRYRHQFACTGDQDNNKDSLIPNEKTGAPSITLPYLPFTPGSETLAFDGVARINISCNQATLHSFSISPTST